MVGSLLTTLVAALAVAAPRSRRQAVGMAGVAGGAAGVDEPNFLRASPTQPELPAPLSPILATHRQAALIVLLESLHELRDPIRRGDGDSYPAGGMLLAAHEPTCRLHRDGRHCSCVQSAVAELERLLTRMRSDEPRLRWHLLAFFVDARPRGRWELRPPRRGKRHLSPLVRRCWLERDPKADKRLAMDGVAWLAEHWNLRDLRGELVEPHLLAPGLDKRRWPALLSAHSGLVRPLTG